MACHTVKFAYRQPLHHLMYDICAAVNYLLHVVQEKFSLKAYCPLVLVLYTNEAFGAGTKALPLTAAQEALARIAYGRRLSGCIQHLVF